MTSPPLPPALRQLKLTSIQLDRLDLYAPSDSARDRNRWCVAHFAVRHSPPFELRVWLASLEDRDLADDMGRRLNTCTANARAAGVPLPGAHEP